MNITKGLLVSSTLSLCGCLPLWLCRLLGRITGFFLWLIPNRSLNTTKINIDVCFPELSSKERRSLVFNSLQHTGMLTFEMAAIWFKSSAWLKKHILTIKNKNLFEEALDDARGLIILLPHIGNWEVFARYFPTLCEVMALYEPSRLPELNSLIKSSREKSGIILAPTNARGVASLLKFLKKGGTTCILPDQLPNQKNSGGVYAPFFRRPCSTMTLVGQLQQRTKAIVISAAAQRVPGGFNIEFLPVDDDIYSDDNLLAATAINKNVESFIHKMPEQYQWEYKRFRREPDGVEKLY